mmetsp:Transcript_118002/g.217112  ORF Transcript_118002/g.217112 Transcript_118002/m.217112 type:complete len:354 (-) Transcript_118002:51-1112(-)
MLQHMDQVLDDGMPKSPRSVEETSTRADTDVIGLEEDQSSATTEQFLELVDVSVADSTTQESSVSAAKCRFSLNPKAPAFAPSQTLMNEHIDPYATAHHVNLAFVIPVVPAFVVHTQAVMNEQVDVLLAALSPETNLTSHGSMTPPDHERPQFPCQEAILPEFACQEAILPQFSCQLPVLRKSAKQSSRCKASLSSSNRRSDTMKAQLEALQLEDPATVFIARGINKLGFSSAKTLKTHFSRYGEVKAIYAPPSRVKSMHGYGEGRQTEAHWRLRAAPLGFIVMKSAEATAQILAEGPEQEVNGVAVRVQPFQRHAAHACTKEIASSGDEDAAEVCDGVVEHEGTRGPSAEAT